MPNIYNYFTNATDEDVIDLTDSSTYLRAPVNFAGNANDSVIVLDDSIGQVSGTEPIAPIEAEETLATRRRKSRQKRATPKKKKKVNNEAETARSLTRERSPLTSSRLGDCPICAEPLGTNPMSSTNCGHVFCTECIKKALRVQKRCPTCRKGLARCSNACHPLYL